MATPFGQALTALGATATAEAGRDPENLTAALLATAPALMIAGIVFLAGVAHLPREMALMLAKLRAAPSRWLSLTPRPPQPRPEAAANVEPPQPPSAS
jgi:hypothetical protein